MTYKKIAQNLDAYTVDEINGEKVIVALPNMAGEIGSRHEGSAVLGRNFILDLLNKAIEHKVVNDKDLQKL